MRTTIHSGRFYFWPIIATNTLAMAFGIGADLTRAFIFSLVISCLASFGFLLNDLWDRKIDDVNQAGHFEHSDQRTLLTGILAAGIFLLFGVSLASWLGWAELKMAIYIAFALMSYSIVLRKFLLLPTLIAAVLAASPLWAPLVLWTKTFDSARWGFAAAFVLMIAGREILMDSRDYRGDIIGRRETVPTIFGVRIAKLMALLLNTTAGILLVVALASQVFLIPIYALAGSAIIAIGVLYLILSSGFKVLSSDTRESIQDYVIRSRIAMALTPLLLLLLGRA